MTSKTDLASRSRGEIQKYDPEKGLKRISVAETAERHFARAKDAAKLLHAIELKLTEQRKFVLWWDGQKKAQGGRGKTSNRSVTGLIDKMTLSRWRRRLADEADFRAALNSAQDRCVALCEARTGVAHVAQNSGEYEWYTPEEIIEAARLVLGEIDLDPASHKNAQKIVRASHYYTAQDDGLAHDWSGRVWMNPPYKQPLIEQFCQKLVDEYAAGRIASAIALTNNGTETAWGQVLLRAASAVCFRAGRVQFWNARETAAPLQGQMLCYFGKNSEDFAFRFSGCGVVFEGS